MARFRFTIFEGKFAKDAGSSEFADAAEARKEAVRRLGDLIAGSNPPAIPSRWRIEVRDDLGRLRFQVQFSVTEGEGSNV